MIQLRIAPIALQDLKDIREYISVDLDSPEAAARIIRYIVEKYKLLTDSPYLGASLSAKIDIETPYRYLVCESYLVFYTVNEGFVEIRRILNGKRDYVRLLFSEGLGS